MRVLQHRAVRGLVRRAAAGPVDHADPGALLVRVAGALARAAAHAVGGGGRGQGAGAENDGSASGRFDRRALPEAAEE